MRMELYIDGQLVDLNEKTDILFNYTVKDMTNPTAVKNTFTKSIQLDGTDTNNKIFGQIWNMSRVQGDNFNPSKRVGFQLYVDDDLVETGYCKLDNISSSSINTYSITLYGGLGDFFYSLMYSNTTGKKKTLATLEYPYDLDFVISKDTVKAAWDSLLYQSNNKWSIINFAPCYNGLSDKIDNDKILVNTNGYTGVMRQYDNGLWVDINGFPSEKSGYTLYNGYCMAELPSEMTEWETRDLRSYLQRPVISMKAIVEACCDPVNNGGYEVELDDDFFSSSNPYYSYGYVTLPMITDMEVTSDAEESAWTVSMGSRTATDRNEKVYFDLNTNITQNAEYRVTVNLEGGVGPYNSQLPYSGTPGDYLYTSADFRTSSASFSKFGGYAVQMVGLDSGGNEVCGSDIYWCTTPLDDGRYLDFDNVAQGFTRNDFKYGTPILSRGFFAKNGNKYRWNDTIVLRMKTNNTLISSIRIKVIAGSGSSYGQAAVVGNNVIYNSKTLNNSWQLNAFTYIADNLILSNSFIVTGLDSGLYSNKLVTKNDLLTTEFSPADYLINYCKLFNLYFEKDPFQKKIYIKTQNNFYDGENVDIDELIDYSRGIDIKPLSFDSNWYTFKYNKGDDSSVSEDYFKNKGVEYGIQRIKTGFDFDADEKNLLQSGVYDNAVSVLETSNYYSIRQSDYYNECPTFLYQNVTIKLFDGNFDTTDITVTSPKTVIEGYFNRYSKMSMKYDAFPKVQLHKGNDPIDGENVLLFYNGFQNIASTSVYQPYYWLTDDVGEMLTLNDNKPCVLYTASPTDNNGNTIGIQLTSLPQFGRYTTIDNQQSIYYSWDFGRAEQLYIPNYNYISEDTTIYERYWKKYIEDLYDIDTRIVTAYVNFKGRVVQDFLKHFYWFNDSYWVINEIIDYNPLNPETTKVKFIKVNNKSNYTVNDAEMPEGRFKILLDRYIIDANGGVISGYTYVDDGGAWYFEDWTDGLTPSVIHGTGNTNFTLTVAPWTGTTDRELWIHGFAEYGDRAIITQKSAWSSFSVNPTSLTIHPSGGSATVTVNNPNGYEWYVIEKPDWVSLNITGSTQTSSTVTVTATEVPINTSRSENIYFYVANAGISVPVKVTQVSGGEIYGNTEYLNVTQFGPFSNGNVAITGGTCLYTVRSTTPWTVTSNKDYCIPQRLSGTGNTQYGETVEVTWLDNSNGNLRNAVLTFINEGGYTVTATKYQQGVEGGEYYLDVTPTVTNVNQSGGTQTITISTNDDWTLN